MICLRGQLKRSPEEWTWTGVWAFGSNIGSQEGLPFAYQFSGPIDENHEESSETAAAAVSSTPPEVTTDTTSTNPSAAVKSLEKNGVPPQLQGASESQPVAVIRESPKPAVSTTTASTPVNPAVPLESSEKNACSGTLTRREPEEPALTKREDPTKPTNPPAIEATTTQHLPAVVAKNVSSGITPKATPPSNFQLQGKVLPASGLWKGSFEAMMPSRKGEQRTTVKEDFTVQWNAEDIKEGKSNTILHVAGRGQNQFGNFKLIGSLDLDTQVLQCHREYIIAPPPAPRSYQTRKRQLSWKRRDIYDEPAMSSASTTNSGSSSTKAVVPRKTSAAASKKAKMTQSLTIQIPVIPMGNTKRVPSTTGAQALPNVPDPYMARWRAAHFLYYYTPPETSDPPKYVVYEGDMVHGMRDGRGVCLYNNGLLYEGEWKDDREHGHGTLQTSDRKMMIYQGEWERGRLHGRGTHYYHESTSDEASSEHEPPKHFYQGEFRENLRNGTGHYQLPDGSIYDGTWREGAMTGRGIFTWPDGSVYDGDWKDNKRHGHGILRASDGFTYDGTWVQNSMDGRGSATYKNGQEYHGMWSRGRREGRGTILFINGAVYEGRFRDDAIDGQGTLKIAKTLLVPRDDKKEPSHNPKTDFMIPLSFQSDLARIHQKAGFSSAGQ